MKKLGFLVIGAAALALAACGRNEADTLNEAEQNYQADELNALANDAAANAELEALGNQQQQLEAENAAAAEPPPPPENATNPAEVEDDVQGM